MGRLLGGAVPCVPHTPQRFAKKKCGMPAPLDFECRQLEKYGREWRFDLVDDVMFDIDSQGKLDGMEDFMKKRTQRVGIVKVRIDENGKVIINTETHQCPPSESLLSSYLPVCVADDKGAGKSHYSPIYHGVK